MNDNKKILEQFKNVVSSKKTITISILPEVKTGMKSTDFTNFIEDKIYTELKLMN